MRMTRRTRTRPAKGFTLIELMVVIAIIAALAAILLPVIGSLLENARARACQKKLSTYSTSLAKYKDSNQNKLPALFRVGNPGSLLSASGSSATCKGTSDDRLASGSPTKILEIRTALGSNATQNFWLLMSGEYMGGSEDAFQCPGDRAWTKRSIPEDKKDDGQFGWTDPKNVSYGLHFPYKAYSDPVTLPEVVASPSDPNVKIIQWPDDPTDKTNFNWADPNGMVTSAQAATTDEGAPKMYQDNSIILADRNPRTAWQSPIVGKLTINSNHEEGLGYVQKGGSSTFYKGTDGKAGIGRDDIYTSRVETKMNGMPCFASEDQSDSNDSNAPFDMTGLSKIPCPDTVIWPLDARK